MGIIANALYNRVCGIIKNSFANQDPIHLLVLVSDYIHTIVHHDTIDTMQP